MGDFLGTRSQNQHHFIIFLHIFSVPVVSKHLVVSNTTWLCILVLLLSIAARAEKPLSHATSCCSIKSPGIQTKDHMRANGVEKVSYSPTNWQPNRLMGIESDVVSCL